MTTIYSLNRDVISYIKRFLDYWSYVMVLETAWLFHTPDEDQHFLLHFFKMITRHDRNRISKPASSVFNHYVRGLSSDRHVRRISPFFPRYFEFGWDRLTREEQQEYEQGWETHQKLYKQQQDNDLMARRLFGDWIIDRNGMPRRPVRVCHSTRNELGEDVEVVHPAYFRAMNEWIKDMQAYFLRGLREHGIKISYL